MTATATAQAWINEDRLADLLAERAAQLGFDPDGEMGPDDLEVGNWPGANAVERMAALVEDAVATGTLVSPVEVSITDAGSLGYRLAFTVEGGIEASETIPLASWVPAIRALNRVVESVNAMLSLV